MIKKLKFEGLVKGMGEEEEDKRMHVGSEKRRSKRTKKKMLFSWKKKFLAFNNCKFIETNCWLLLVFNLSKNVIWLCSG